MYLSNRLTFSLVCFILLLAFVALPVMAAPNGPTVTITEYTGKVDDAADAVDHVQTRSDFRVKIAFSHALTAGEFVASDVYVGKAATSAGALTEITGSSFLTNLPATETTANQVWVISIDMADTAYNQGYLLVQVPVDVATGNTGSTRGIGNQAASQGFTDLPQDTALDDWTIEFALAVAADAATPATPTDDELLDADEILGDGNLASTATFTVKVTATYTGSADPAPTSIPTIDAGQIYIGGMPLSEINTPTEKITSNPASGSTLTSTESASPFIARVVYTVGAEAYMPGEIALNPMFADSTGLDLSTTLNEAPTTVGTIDAQMLEVGAAATSINAADYFMDTDTLTYTAMSSDTAKATVSVTASVVVITAAGPGSATITVTATDTANQTATQDIAVTVTDPNNAAPTTVGTIGAQTLTAGADATTIDAADFFNDTDTLTYTAMSSDTAKATVAVTGSMVAITPVAAGTATITVTATDTVGQTVDQTIEVTVNAPPNPTLDISLVANSLDTTAKTFQVKFQFAKVTNGAAVPTEFAGSNVKVTTDAAGETVAAIPVATVVKLQGDANMQAWIASVNYSLAALPLYVGQTGVPVSDTTVSDAASTTGLLAVGVVENMAPTTVGTIAAQTLAEGTAATTIDAADYFNDADALTYTASSSDTAKATVAVTGSMVAITPVAAGTATITVTAMDTAGQTATQDITVTVNPPTPPTVNISLVPNSLDTAAKTFQVKFEFAKASDDGADVPATFTSANVQVTTDDAGQTVAGIPVPTVTALLGGMAWIASIDYSLAALPLYVGQTGIDVSATTVGGAASTTGLLTVNIPNPVPTAVGTIDAQTLMAGAAATAIDVESNFSDTEALTYTASSSDATIATVSVTGSMVSITPVAAGTATITVTATDTAQQSVNQTIAVTVNAPNAAPTAVGTITAQTLTAGDAATAIDVVSNFSDTDALTYTAFSSDTAIATVSVAGSMVSITPVAAGTATITVTATDTANQSVNQTIAVTVNAPGTTIPDIDTTKPSFTVDVTPDLGSTLAAGDEITFTLTATEPLGTGNNELMATDVQGTTNVASQRFVRASNTVYVVIVTPTDHTKPIVITIPADSVFDTADIPNGNAEWTTTFTPADEVNPTVVITSAPGTGNDAGKIVFKFTFSEPLAATGSGTFTSDDLIRGTGATLAGNPVMDSTDNKVWTVLVNPSATGDTVLTLKTGAVTDTSGNPLEGDQAHTHVPPTPPTPPGPATITTTDLGSTTAGATLTITFSKDPGAVTAAGSTLPGTGTTRMITAAATAGSHSVALTWTGTDAGTSDDGTGTVTYTIPTPPVFVSNNPTSPSNIMMVEIPANAYVVLVRAMSTTEGALKFPNVPPVGGTAVDVRAWSDMPDLHDLFLTSTQNRGGAIVLRKSADARDNDNADGTGTYATPAVGTVGISEIMWGRDLGKADAAAQAAGQWIELQNLNSKPVKVLIYAQKGSDGLVSGGLLVNTAAGDSLLGNPGGMVVDAIQNIRNDGNQGHGGWNVKGKDGNSVTGDHFASMHRILPHNKPDYRNADGSRYNNRKGTKDSHWAESGTAYLRAQTAHATPVLFDYRGSPGDVNSRTGISLITPAGRTGISHEVYINEVGNNSNNSYDWIELKGAAGKNLRNYMISIVTNNNSDVPLIQFPANDNAKIADSGVFLILSSDPAENQSHPIAPGRNVNRGQADHQQYHWNSPVRYIVTNFSLPNDGKFVLVLRKPDNHEGHRSGQHKDKGVAETGNNDLNRITDIAGWDDNLSKGSYPNNVSSTGVWPLYRMRDIRGFTNNSFRENTVHQRNRVGTNDGASGVGAQDNRNDRTAFGDRHWTGVGYRRGITGGNQHGGTPGYDNGALQNRGGGIVASVYISEIMYADGSNGTLPQWIELRNTSKTVGADLHNWRLTITNHDLTDDEGGLWDGKASASVLLRGLKIKPNSAVLISTRKAARSEVFIPSSDIFTLYPTHRGAFGMTSPNDDVINVYGFKITLHTRGNEGSQHWELVDEVSNLSTTSDRRGNRERFDPVRWVWPNGMNEDGDRVSVARANDPGGTEADGFVLASGTTQAGWMLSSMDDRTNNIDYVFYGHKDDISTPGQTVRSALPVNLSFFRPTLEEGQIVIRWTTESELDNAGFNILRSDTKDGGFKQVNEQMIQGKGTTGERSTYKWVDTTAKPDAVYYYQIEDVSFAGERQTLATTKLKGLISAKGKLTTTWGNLKEASQ